MSMISGISVILCPYLSGVISLLLGKLHFNVSLKD